MRKEVSRIPEAELEVMKTVWAIQQPVGTGKLAEVLSEEKGWSRSTVQVLLSRLEEREFLKCERKGRFKYYTALIKEEEYCKQEAKSVLKSLFHNSYKRMIASLVEDEELSKEDLNEIMDIVNGGVKKDE